jgi:hypothetical protein
MIAAVSWPAQGQVAARRSRRRQLPRASRPAAANIRLQSFGFPGAGGAVQGRASASRPAARRPWPPTRTRSGSEPSRAAAGCAARCLWRCGCGPRSGRGGGGEVPGPRAGRAGCRWRLHDAAELLLGALADKLGASLPNHLPFMDYWRQLDPRVLSGGVKLPARQRMDRVNAQRNLLKHKGVLPGAAAIDQACSDVRAFLEDSAMLVFGLDLMSIDMAELVPHVEVRKLLQAAALAEDGGDRQSAMARLADAFEALLTHRWVIRRLGGAMFGPTICKHMDPESIVATLVNLHKGDLRSGSVIELAHEIHEAVSSAQAMQATLPLMVLGIDYRQFDRFQRLTPSMEHTGQTEYSYPYDEDCTPSKADVDFCRQFIITVALRRAELDAMA